MTTEDLSALETQLREKEQLVSALTERLEQAAEQLDRIRRSGGDRNVRVAGGIPAELVEEQKTLVTDLQQAVQQWSDMQPSATLARIEVQITELRDLVAGKLPEGGFRGMADTAHSAHFEPPAERTRQQMPESKGSGLSGYEAMKAQLLDLPVPPSRQAASPNSAPMKEQPGAISALKEEIANVDPPEMIDLNAAGVDDLRKAVEQRDAYISFLTRKLRAAEMCYQDSINWEVLNNAPDDLRRRLEDLEKTLHATLRHAEIDHSLERARLAREATRLELLEEQVRREMKRLNLSENGGEAETEEVGAEHHDSGMNTRWQRLFGKK